MSVGPHRLNLFIVPAFALALTLALVPPSGAVTGGSGRNPGVLPTAVATQLATVPNVSFDSVGTSHGPVPLAVTTNQPRLARGGRARIIFFGAEFCPFCAVMSWPLVVALDRFGTFHNLKLTTSTVDVGPIPMISFVGARYSSPYIVFSPYEVADRYRVAFQPIPSDVRRLIQRYDGNGSIPFVDIGNGYLAEGPSEGVAAIVGLYADGRKGPSVSSFAGAFASPLSSAGAKMGAPALVGEANYLSAAICRVDGGQPGRVCNSAGVEAAASALHGAKPAS